MKASDRFTRWLAYLVVGAFGAVAIFCSWTYGRAVWMSWQASDWVAVPAQVDHWEVKSTTSTTSRGIRTHTQVVAQYRYTWQGQDYASTRVGFSRGTDNFSDDFRRRAISALRDPPAGHVVAWIDPERPGYAVLVRSLPWEQALFMAIFLIMPCGISTFAMIAGLDLLRMRLFDARDNPAPIGSIWALLHGATAIPIIALAPPGAFGFGPWLLIGLLLTIAAFGFKGLVARLTETPHAAGKGLTHPR
ncbi:DUF3592 domain-containing protein [Variovorax sp. VNK109]|uniref:DUF3592 domain-containing protein n=1 Tax=Variovorax sp. VNK109 TaxID=3400919 RepID=UPI003BFD193F